MDAMKPAGRIYEGVSKDFKVCKNQINDQMIALHEAVSNIID